MADTRTRRALSTAFALAAAAGAVGGILARPAPQTRQSEDATLAAGLAILEAGLADANSALDDAREESARVDSRVAGFEIARTGRTTASWTDDRRRRRRRSREKRTARADPHPRLLDTSSRPLWLSEVEGPGVNGNVSVIHINLGLDTLAFLSDEERWKRARESMSLTAGQEAEIRAAVADLAEIRKNVALEKEQGADQTLLDARLVEATTAYRSRSTNVLDLDQRETFEKKGYRAAFEGSGGGFTFANVTPFRNGPPVRIPAVTTGVNAVELDIVPIEIVLGEQKP